MKTRRLLLDIKSKNQFQRLQSSCAILRFKVQNQCIELFDYPKLFKERYNSLLKTIVIRKSYEDLYKLMVSNMRSLPENKCADILLTGVPGLGKSVSIIYFIYQYIKDSNTHFKSAYSFIIL